MPCKKYKYITLSGRCHLMGMMLVTLFLLIFLSLGASVAVLNLEAVPCETNRLIFDYFLHLRHSVTPSLRIFDNTYPAAEGYE